MYLPDPGTLVVFGYWKEQSSAEYRTEVSIARRALQGDIIERSRETELRELHRTALTYDARLGLAAFVHAGGIECLMLLGRRS